MSGEILHCPSCSSALSVPGDVLGREVKCPRCERIFTARVEQPAAPPAAPRTAVQSWRDEPEEREPPRPPRRDIDEDARWDVRHRGGRAYALSRVHGPGILLQVYGILWLLGAAGLLVLAGYGMMQLTGSPNQPLSSGAREDAIAMCVLGGLGGLFSGVLGALVWWGGTRMKALRSYGLALTAVILTFILGAAICIVLCAVGIWPLVVLCDAGVREEFR